MGRRAVLTTDGHRETRIRKPHDLLQKDAKRTKFVNHRDTEATEMLTAENRQPTTRKGEFDHGFQDAHGWPLGKLNR